MTQGFSHRLRRTGTVLVAAVTLGATLAASMAHAAPAPVIGAGTRGADAAPLFDADKPAAPTVATKAASKAATPPVTPGRQAFNRLLMICKRGKNFDVLYALGAAGATVGGAAVLVKPANKTP